MTEVLDIRGIKIGEGIPKICIPVMGSDKESIREETQRILEYPFSILEWRADFFNDVYDACALEETLGMLREMIGEEKLLLFTFRTQAQGGMKELLEKDYFSLLLTAASCEAADLIDMEDMYDTDKERGMIDWIQDSGAKVIASCHDFEKTPSNERMLSILSSLDKTGADILKLSVMANTPVDTLRLLQTTFEYQNKSQKPIISMAMGDLGTISRIAGETYGSCITFGSGGMASAPGQLPVEDLEYLLSILH